MAFDDLPRPAGASGLGCQRHGASERGLPRLGRPLWLAEHRVSQLSPGCGSPMRFIPADPATSFDRIVGALRRDQERDRCKPAPGRSIESFNVAARVKLLREQQASQAAVRRRRAVYLMAPKPASLSEDFRHFVTSMPAAASGWSVRRVGFAPTGRRRLFTAHTHSRISRHSINCLLVTLGARTASSDALKLTVVSSRKWPGL